MTTETPARSRDDLRIFQASYQRPGLLEPAVVFQVGWDESDALERLDARLTAEFGELRYAILPTVLEVHPNDMPGVGRKVTPGKEDEAFRIRRDVERQKNAICPPPPRIPSGPMFVFWNQTATGAKHRYVVVNRNEDADAARKSAEQHAAANGVTLLGGCNQMEVAEFLAEVQKRGRSETEVFGQLTPSNAYELALMFRDAFALRVAEFGQRIASEATEKFSFPDPRKLSSKCPRPDAITQAAFHILETTRPVEETPADKRERLERRRERIHAGVGT